MARLTINRFEDAAKRFENAEASFRPKWEAKCGCSAPGEQSRCWDCPYYKGLGRLIQGSLHSNPVKAFARIPPPVHEDPYADSVKQQCCEMYQHGYSIQDIQYLVGVPSRRILRDWLREVGLAGRSAQYPEHLKQKCLKMYADRLTPRQIEDETGIPADTITDWALHEKLSRKTKYPEKTKQQCLDLYTAGHSSEDIHAMTGIPVNTICAWIAKAKLGRAQKRYSDEEKQKCRVLYGDGKTPSQIETITGIKKATIRSWIRKELWNPAEEIDTQLLRGSQSSRKAQLSSERKPVGHWKNFETLKHEILQLNEARGKLGMMPTATELRELERGDIVKAITKQHGGFQSVAERAGLAYRKKRSQYWHDFEHVKGGLFDFIKQHGTPGVMPTKAQLEAVQMGSLCVAIDLHGGFPKVAKQLKLKLSYDRKPRGYWKNPANLKSEIENVAAQLGNPGVLPTHEELKQLGRNDLISAIASNGGWFSVARCLGLSYAKQYNNPNDYF